MADGLNKTAIVITVLLIAGALVALYMMRTPVVTEVPTTVYVREDRPWWPYAPFAALPFWYGSGRGYVPGPGPRPTRSLPPPPGPRPPHPPLPGPQPTPSPEFPTPAMPRPTPLGPGATPA